MNNLDQNIRKISIYSGVALGLLQVALNIFLFYLTTSIPASPFVILIAAPQLCSLVIPLFAAIFFSINIRRKIGGLWTFKQAATGIFVMLLAAYLVRIIGSDLIFDKVVEPYSVQKIQSADIKAKVTILEQRHSTPKQIEAAVNDLKKDFAGQDIDTWHSIQGYIIFVLFIFIFALILAALLRNAKYVPASEAT